MKGYNYSIAEDYKQKLVIPYLGIEMDGWLTFFSAVLGIATVVIVIGLPLSFLMGEIGFYIALAIAIIGILGSITYINEINQETGKNRLQELYFTSIKKYRFVYDHNGAKHFLTPKKEGMIYINARR